MKHIVDYIKKYPLLLLLIIPAFFIYLLIIFPSGSFYCFKEKCGIYFWGVHGHDAIWHLAIANASFNKIPFVAPTFAGALLSGYNYLLDLVIFLLAKFAIPSMISYFKLLPMSWFVIFTYLLIVLGRKIKDSPLFVGLLLFFTYFTGSFSYFLNLYHHQTIWGASGLLATINVHTMSNLPFAFSLLILLTILIIIKNKKINLKTVLVLGLLNFLSLGLKFYGGAISVFLVFAFIFFTYVKVSLRKMIGYLALSLLFVMISIVIFYDPATSLKTGSVLKFSPFSLIHTVTEEPNLFYLRKLTDARYFLMTKGVGIRLILIEFFNLAVFLFFYLGTKFFGLVYLGVRLIRRKLNSFDGYVLGAIIFATSLTTLFIQKAEWWNVIQFFYYAIFLAAIPLAELATEILRKKTALTLITVVFLILLSLPNTIDVIKQYAVFPGAAYVSREELKALEFLKKLPDGIVFTPLYDRSVRDAIGPNELYAYEDTAYVPAFSGKQVYFANVLQLRLTGVSYEDRLKEIEKNDCNILNKVDYVYEVRHLRREGKLVECDLSRVKKIFNNEAVFIYSVKK